MRFSALFLTFLALGAGALSAADTTIRVEVDTSAQGTPIPERFAGLSFETADILAKPDGSHQFSPDNKALVQLYKTLGLRSLRIGGNTADRPSVAMPTEADVDSLFAFAQAVDAKVIYTLRLRGSDPAVAVPMARYIWAHHRDLLDRFAIGNEPNIYAKTFEDYLKILNTYKAAVLAPDVAPGATFCGPSTTPNKAEWAKDLAEQVGRKGGFTLMTQHEYVGGAGNKVTDPAEAREKLLSDSLHGGYAKIRDALAPAAKEAGIPWRIEETNSFYNGGARHVSNTLASALWALDYLHWFALNGSEGINFHSGDYVAAGEKQARCWYATFWNTPAGLEAHPIAYALAAFRLAGKGVELPVTLTPVVPQVSVYAVRLRDGGVAFTIVNRSHADATLSLVVTGLGANRPLFRFDLVSANGNVADEEGVSLAGGVIATDGTLDPKNIQTIAAKDVPSMHDRVSEVVVRGGSASVVVCPTDRSSM